MPTDKFQTNWTLRNFVELVQQLRAAQKASGTGYKATAVGTSATSLEKSVDAAIQTIEKHHLF
jgi:hypothetical protein